MAVTASQIMKLLKSTKSFEKVMEKVNVISLENGKCVAELEVGTEHSNILGGLHGGFSATLIDNISTYALLTHKYGGAASVSVDLHATYIKGAKIGDTIIIDANTLKVGKTLAFLEVLIKNKATGELLQKGSHTKFLLQNAP